MANWDHLSNVGTHPVLDPDVRTSTLARLEAAAYQAARHDAHLDRIRGEADAAGLSFFEIRAAVSAGRARVREQVSANTLP